MADWVYKAHRDEGGWGVAPDDPTISAVSGINSARITWSQPAVTKVGGQTICHTKGIMIRRSTGKAPETETDGDLVIDSADMTGSVTDSGLANGTTYYYRAFPYSANGVYNRGSEAVSASPDDAATLNITFTASAIYGSSITAELNGTTYTAEISSSGVATFKFKETGTANIGGKKVSITRMGQTYSLTGTVFACQYDESNSAPISVTYPAGYDNANYAAFAMNLSSGVPSYGGWSRTGKAAFLFPRSCMLGYDGIVDYYLNEDDETRKADGTASDIADSSYDGNVMMEWNKDNTCIAWGITAIGTTGWRFVVADMIVGDLKPWNLYNAEGEVADHWYTAKYFGSTDGTRLRSISGASNMVSQTRDVEITRAEANNTTDAAEWYTEVYADRVFVMLLCYLLGKTTNTQAAFGAGRCSSNNTSASKPGALNGLGMFYGRSNNTTGVKVFGMENPWGNINRAVAGLVTNSSSHILYKMTYGKEDGSTVNGYNLNGSGYVDTNVVPTGTNGGYIRHVSALNNALIPATISGSATTYYCDTFNYAASRYAIAGGAWSNGNQCGAANIKINNASTYKGSSTGAALSCKPVTKDTTSGSRDEIIDQIKALIAQLG